MPIAAKIARLFPAYFSNKIDFLKIFDGEILIKILPTTLLQVFCEIMSTAKLIFKSIKDPDDICHGEIIQV